MGFIGLVGAVRFAIASVLCRKACLVRALELVGANTVLACNRTRHRLIGTIKAIVVGVADPVLLNAQSVLTLEMAHAAAMKKHAGTFCGSGRWVL